MLAFLLHRISTLNFLFYDLSAYPLLEVPGASVSWVSLGFTGTWQPLLGFYKPALILSFPDQQSQLLTTCLLALRFYSWNFLFILLRILLKIILVYFLEWMTVNICVSLIIFPLHFFSWKLLIFKVSLYLCITSPWLSFYWSRWLLMLLQGCGSYLSTP